MNNFILPNSVALIEQHNWKRAIRENYLLFYHDCFAWFELIILLHVISMMLVLLCIWSLLHLKYRGKWGRFGMGWGNVGMVGGGFKVCRDGWGWGQKFVPMQVSKTHTCGKCQSDLLGNVERPAVGFLMSPITAENFTKYWVIWFLETL